eukprot:TRINITY_DN857_c0_g1_i1.p1 TRINITY_DN857_c0_g1~~TRINITY_DN857_c0_g1_i1.p1  ORF type:complete len:194 (-),score=14.69 TRINITY_DN857_c0_g1_i1:404-985(-)
MFGRPPRGRIICLGAVSDVRHEAASYASGLCRNVIVGYMVGRQGVPEVRRSPWRPAADGHRDTVPVHLKPTQPKSVARAFVCREINGCTGLRYPCPWGVWLAVSDLSLLGAVVMPHEMSLQDTKGMKHPTTEHPLVSRRGCRPVVGDAGLWSGDGDGCVTAPGCSDVRHEAASCLGAVPKCDCGVHGWSSGRA